LLMDSPITGASQHQRRRRHPNQDSKMNNRSDIKINQNAVLSNKSST
jgi:hypothetical protein